MSARTRRAASWPTRRSLYRHRPRDNDEELDADNGDAQGHNRGCWAAREISQADVASSAMPQAAAPAPRMVVSASRRPAGRTSAEHAADRCRPALAGTGAAVVHAGTSMGPSCRHLARDRSTTRSARASRAGR